MLQKLFNPEWQITCKSFLLSTFLIGFSFSPTAEISRLELEFEESLPRKTASIFREGIGQESRKTNFLTLPDLAFGFVHKRSGNEIIRVCKCRFSRPQSTASHLFARTRSFHRPTYKRPGFESCYTRKTCAPCFSPFQ